MSPAPSSLPSPCADCDTNPGRREFLREIAGIAAGVAGALGIGTVRAAALSVDFTSGLSALGEEVTFPIPTQDGVTVDKAREVILVRYEQSVYAFALSCPHQQTPLRWHEADHVFQCPKHKSTFKPDGGFVEGRATRDMDRYGIRREGDSVVVDLAKVYRDDENRENWIAAVVRL